MGGRTGSPKGSRPGLPTVQRPKVNLLSGIPCPLALYYGAVSDLRYAAAACQTDLVNPLDRAAMGANTDRMLAMIDAAVAGSAPFLPVRLIVFPEFAHAAPVFPTVAELREKIAVPIPNEHTERLHRKARELGVYIQSGSMIEMDA